MISTFGSKFEKGIFDKRPSIRKWMRRTSSGCLEYRGRSKGRSAGNPLVSINWGRGTMHLRRWVWIQHHGSLPKGKYIHLKCLNFRCHEITHMHISKIHPHGDSYRPKKNEYILRYSPNKYRTILYYRGKVSGEVIGKLVGLKSSAFTLWRSVHNSEITIPDGWHPSPAFDRRVEDVAVSTQKIYLCYKTLAEAKKDISQSQLPQIVKDIVLCFLQGEYSSSVSRKYKRSYSGTRYIYRRALLSIYRDVGPRRWINLASKGQIRLWSKSNYR